MAMRSITVTMNLGLDGVVQGLGRPGAAARGCHTDSCPAQGAGRPDLAIGGSAALVRALHAVGLIDRYTLVINPITLGCGRRMFEDPAPLTRFSLTGSVTTAEGVIVAHYDRR